MTIDLFGQATSLTSPKAQEEWDACMMAFLAHGAATPVHLTEVIDAEPEFALAHAVKGLFFLLLGRRELIETAADAHALASKLPALPREKHYVKALGAWLNGSPTGAIAQLEEVLLDTPGDALAAKLSHAIRFVLGDLTGMRASVEAVLPAYGTDHAARGYLLGCHAFALEESGEYDAAVAAGHKGLDLCPDDAWGLHAVAHVYDMTGDPNSGLGWLTGREAAWSHCNNFRYHVWWHKALMHLDLGETDAALDLYDQEIRAERTDDYRDISNAASLLFRLELDDINIGNRWEELADLSEKRTEDGCLIFADLHYLLSLVGGGRTEAARTLTARIAASGKAATSEMDERMEEPGEAMARGLEAFGDGDYGRAFMNLTKGRKTLQAAGGSHAQRDVFERLTIDAGLRAGRFDEAERVLLDRTTARGGYLDGYAEARHGLIAQARRIPAE